MFYLTATFEQIIGWAIFWFLVALIWAIAEIELEGQYGWSEKSATWYRVAKNHPQNLFLKLVMAGKPLTGYHLPIFGLCFLISHLWLLVLWQWSVIDELLTIALFLTWTPLWDSLWIWLNPHYGLKNCGPKKIWWYSHSRWLGNFLPLENISQWLFSIIITGGVSLYLGNQQIVVNQLFMLGWLIIFSGLAVVFFRPIYDRYYWRMRQSDDRKAAGIFH